MRFPPEEVELFETAKELLTRRCEAWAKTQGLGVDPFILSAALDFRHESVDGRLGFWTADLVHTFLLEWMPRKVSTRAEDAADSPETLRTLLRYLRQVELDDPTGDPAPELEAAITDAAREFAHAMSDERNFGMAKFWVMQAVAAGIDPADTEAMQRFVESVQDGQVAYDAEALDRIVERHVADGGEPERALPQLPVTLPSECDLAASAEQSQVVQQLRTFTEWVGDGRPLTSTGQLKLADARELVDLLGTGDVIDPVIGDRTFRTASSADLPELALIVGWARKTRLVRVVKNRLVRVAKAKPLLKDGLALWLRAFDSVSELADVMLPQRFSGPDLFALMFDETLPDVLNSVYGFRAPVPLARLEESVWLACRTGLMIGDSAPAEQRLWRKCVDHDLRRTLESLADLGAVELSAGRADPMFSLDLDPAPDGEDDPAAADAAGLLPPEARERIGAALAGETDLVRLTPLGTYAVRRRLLAEGRHAPLVGELRDATAGQLLGTVAEHHDVDSSHEEIGLWLAARDTDGPGPLLDAVRRCPFRTRASAMLSVLADCQSDSERFLRALRADAALAPVAICLLIERGQLGRDDLTPPEAMLGMTEQLLQVLELRGPGAVREMLAATPDLPELGQALAHSGHPDAAGLQELRTLVIEPSTGRSLRVAAGPRRPRRRRPRVNCNRKR